MSLSIFIQIKMHFSSSFIEENVNINLKTFLRQYYFSTSVLNDLGRGSLGLGRGRVQTRATPGRSRKKKKRRRRFSHFWLRWNTFASLKLFFFKLKNLEKKVLKVSWKQQSFKLLSSKKWKLLFCLVKYYWAFLRFIKTFFKIIFITFKKCSFKPLNRK